MASCLGQPKAAHSCHLQALTLEAPVPHPLRDSLPIGDRSPMCQSLRHCLDIEQEPVVEGCWDDIHLQGRTEPGWGGTCEGRSGRCGEGDGGAGSREEEDGRHCLMDFTTKEMPPPLPLLLSMRQVGRTKHPHFTDEDVRFSVE